MNNHQKNSLIALEKKLKTLGENDAANLVTAVLENDHHAMLKNKVYGDKS